MARTIYRPSDREKLAQIQVIAEQLWYDEWVRHGSPEEGSCCAGKGFRIKFLPERKRLARDWYIARADFCQGNLSAQATKAPVERYLHDCGIDAEYYDGRMD